MNEKVFTVSEIRAAQEKVREKRMEEINGKKAFAMIMLADADLFTDEIIATLTGNEKAENN